MQTTFKPIGMPLSGINASQRPKQNPIEQKQPLPGCLQASKADQQDLAILLTQCYDALKVYGKEPEQLDNLIKMFILVLGDYIYSDIKNAFKVYLKTNTSMPTPADIVNIIEPPPPKIDWALYIEFKKRLREGVVYVSSEEKEFLRMCERIGVDRMRGETENYANAQRELESHRMRMLRDE